MPSPAVDIIVPVWNNPFETRACLAAILECSPAARLIIIDNGSSRETQLMLEEFSEQLEERGLFITSERNIGLVPAINRGLAHSTAEFAVIVRPSVTVSSGWLEALLEAGGMPGAGLVSPTFKGTGAPQLARPLPGCPLAETFSISFETLLIRGELLRLLGNFDESLDGGEWCLRDYLRRAEAAGYHVCVIAQPELACSGEAVFGSPERRRERQRNSRESYLARWGIARHYCIYFGSDTQAADLGKALESLTAAARRGHRFTLLLHGRQHREFRKRGWNGLHTAVQVRALPLFGTKRALARLVGELKSTDPDLVLVAGGGNADFPGAAATLKLEDLAASGPGGEAASRSSDHSREAA